MPSPFNTDLDGLRQRLLTMASHAAQSVQGALKAVLERDDDLARQVETDDNRIDELEKEVDELAIHLLLRAPLARDLRFIVVAIKISHDLERVGDEATAIARRAIELNREMPLRPPPSLSVMTEMVVTMLATTLEAFVNDDGAKARSAIARDREVDALNRQLQRELTAAIVISPAEVTRLLAFMTICRRLERIGDHAKNVAEEVVYLCEARDIRHSQKLADAGPTAL